MIKPNKSIKFASKRRWLGLRKKRFATYFGRYVYKQCRPGQNKMKAILVLALSILLPQPAISSEYNYDSGLKAYKSEKYDIAIDVFKNLAEQGHIKSQMHLAFMYDYGKGVQQNYKQAIYWYQKAAEQEDIGAKLSLAAMYILGRGVKQDYQLGYKFRLEAAEQGSPLAKYYLGSMYANGEGVKQNRKAAKEWYGKACDEGNQGGCSGYRELNEQGY